MQLRRQSRSFTRPPDVRLQYWLTVGAASALALSVAACGGQISFAGKAPLTVAGDPPPPPPPPPAPEPKKEEPPPRVEVRDNKIEIREKIQFDHAKATIKPESHSLLNEIVDVIKKNPHIKKIAIEGHASSDGNKQFNKKLSADRAKSVMAFLVEKGVAKGTLTSQGFGSEKPIATNDTEEGREKNRRVEFNIVEQDITQKKVAIDEATGKEKVISEKAIPAKDSTAEEEKADDASKADEKKTEKKGLSRPKAK